MAHSLRVGLTGIRALTAQAARILAPKRTVRARGLRFALHCPSEIAQYRWKTYNTKEPETLEVYSVALGSRVGVSRLHIQDTTPGAALHTESRDAIRLTRTHKPVIWWEGICTFTLDVFCEEAGLSPQAMKIDVDGTEPEILQGASRTLRSRTLRTLLVEMFGGPSARSACAQLLLAAGLERVWSDPARSDNEIWGRQ